MSEELQPLESWNCFACGPSHPSGLRLSFEAEDNRVLSRFNLSHEFTGTGPVLHGGVIATVFDETMAWCLLRFRRKLYFTTHLDIRYRKPILADEDLVATAWIDRVRGRRVVEVESAITGATEPDRTLAQATATFIEAPEDVMQSVPLDQRNEMERVLASFD